MWVCASPEGRRLPHVSSSNFIISAAVLNISRKATAVKERADFIGTLYFCTQNPRQSCVAIIRVPFIILSVHNNFMSTSGFVITTGRYCCIRSIRYFQKPH